MKKMAQKNNPVRLSVPGSSNQGQSLPVVMTDHESAQASEVGVSGGIGHPADADHLTLKQWSANPRKMWNWRSETFRRSLLELERMAFTEQARAADQLKALELLQKMSERIDDVGEDLETLCPKCKHKFVPG